MKRVGVLALQGDFDAHRRALERAGAEALEVRTAAELASVDGLVIPGGESTTMLKLLREENLFEPLREFGARRPIFGTCAGAILLAQEDGTRPARLGLLDAIVARNAFGRQIDSFSRDLPLALDGADRPFHCVFIRAPRFTRLGPSVRVLGELEGEPVLVEAPGLLAGSFHPELTDDLRVHRHFLAMRGAASPVAASKETK